VPTYFNPRRVDIDPGGGGGLVAAVVVVVAAGAGLIWLARELARVWVELAIIAGGTVAFVVIGGTWLAIHFRRGVLPVNRAAQARAIAAAGVPMQQAAIARQIPARKSSGAITEPGVIYVHSEIVSDRRTEALAIEVAALRAELAAMPERQAIAPVQQHLHLHGITAEDVAALVDRQQSNKAIER
jgi:hypothetical protein